LSLSEHTVEPVHFSCVHMRALQEMAGNLDQSIGRLVERRVEGPPFRQTRCNASRGRIPRPQSTAATPPRTIPPRPTTYRPPTPTRHRPSGSRNTSRERPKRETRVGYETFRTLAGSCKHWRREAPIYPHPRVADSHPPILSHSARSAALLPLH
jgi:hypothetical protein